MNRGREVSEAFKRAVFAEATEEVYVILVTINHPQLIRPFYLVNHTSNIQSRGQTYLACPLDIELPMDSDDQQAVAKIAIDNLDKAFIASLRSITNPPTITLELVRASSPEVIEAQFVDLTLREVNYDYRKITGTLTFEAFYNEPFPGYDFTPSYFAGLF